MTVNGLTFQNIAATYPFKSKIKTFLMVQSKQSKSYLVAVSKRDSLRQQAVAVAPVIPVKVPEKKAVLAWVSSKFVIWQLPILPSF